MIRSNWRKPSLEDPGTELDNHSLNQLLLRIVRVWRRRRGSADVFIQMVSLSRNVVA